MPIIAKSFRLSEEDSVLINELKKRTNIPSDIGIIRYCLKFTHNATTQPTQDSVNMKEVNLYEGWNLVSEGNDPEQGDYKKIKKLTKPWTEKVLWYGDEGFSDF